MNNKWLYVAGFSLLLALLFLLYRKYQVAPEITFGSLRLVDLDNKPVVLSTGGDATVVTFGASWCSSCIREMNDIMEIKNTALSEVRVVVISDEPLESIRRFRDRKDYPFTFLKLQGSFKDVGINSIPTTYLYNRKGELKKESVGYIHWDDPSTVNHLLHLMK
jgi:thiol-disulfide isomerase/thioredoxin